ncbi:MAG: 2-dehydropantoate 2-reductase [Allobaculum sp.]|nr:2-dehydropantoate 2-reductase [Allobaculum sp.]
MIQTVYVCGRGAVGTTIGDLFATYLPEERFAFLVDSNRKARYENQPILVNGQAKTYRYLTKEEATSENQADLIFFACKSYSLDEAMEEAAPFIQDKTILMSGINGIESENRLKRRFPNQPIVHAIAQNMDSCYDSKKQDLHFTTRGEIVFGPATSDLLKEAKAVEELFLHCHIPYIFSSNILLDQGSKLMFNCGINQVCAAYNATYGEVANNPVLFELFKQAMEEARLVLAALHQDPGQAALDNWAYKITTFDPNSMPSMAQDIKANRPLELDLFSGTILPLAQQAHIETPVLEDLYQRLSSQALSEPL